VTTWPGDFVKSLPGLREIDHRWYALPFHSVSVFPSYDLMSELPVNSRELTRGRIPGPLFPPRLRPGVAALAPASGIAIDVVFRGRLFVAVTSGRVGGRLEAVAGMAIGSNIVLHLDRFAS